VAAITESKGPKIFARPNFFFARLMSYPQALSDYMDRGPELLREPVSGLIHAKENGRDENAVPAVCIESDVI
jgi:hypothetical protein